MKHLGMIVAMLFVVQPLFAQNQGVTLKECYDMAVKQSETIAITDELIKQAEALYGQAWGSTLPEIFFGYDSTWQDRPSTSGATPGTFFITPQTNTRIGARKNLLTGYREFAAINSGSTFVDQRKDEKSRALQLLFSDVAGAFYGVLQAEADLAITKKNLGILQDRLKETKQRANVGRNRSAEVAALEAQAYTSEAQTLEAERLIKLQREFLSFLTGKPMMEQTLQPFDVRSVESDVASYIARLDKRPDIQAQEKAVDVSLAAVRLERSKHFPNLGLGANYYLDRTGFREDVKWDAILNLEIPIWSWGATQKGVNAAKAENNRQALLARQIRRRAEMEVQNAFREMTSARQQRDIYEKASVSSEREHTLTTRDYRSGLVSTFEVLETMNRFYETQRGYNLSVLRERLSEVNMKIAAGYLPEEILK
jgi:outer membrane protein